MRRLPLVIISLFILCLVIAPLYVYGSPDTGLAIERAARIFTFACLFLCGWKIAAKFPPRGISALLLVLACWSTRAADPAYKPGDRVTVLDAAAQSHVADIVQLASNGWYRVAIDGETRNDEGEFLFPSANIRPAGWGERAAAAFTERTQRVRTWGATLATAAAAWLAKDAQLSSDKDTNQTEVSAAAIQAKQAADDALRNGPPDGSRYYISGTFTGPQAYSVTGSWTPALTLISNTDGRGGAVVRATISNKPDGAEQAIEGKGTWTVLGQGRISIKGVDEIYNGDATLEGISPYGPVAFAGASIRLASGATLTGGTAQNGNPPEVSP